VALGSNLGDRKANLRRALRWLDALPGVSVQAASPFLRTAPVGPPQPDYLNAVARLQVHLAPLALLDALLTLERAAGRVRRPGERWGPRTLDLDLLVMADPLGHLCRIAHPRLTLPHPRLEERRFVLEPFARLDPGLTLASGLTVAARLATLP
jgi:2-amino-4-hydroxy-6-hydroxymethyldihydropteridine diphosphokinase